MSAPRSQRTAVVSIALALFITAFAGTATEPLSGAVTTDNTSLVCQFMKFLPMCRKKAATIRSAAPAVQLCTAARCGAQPNVANILCPDKTTMSGPTGRCLLNTSTGTCSWEVLSCSANDASAAAVQCASAFPKCSGRSGMATAAATCGGQQYVEFNPGPNAVYCMANDGAGRCFRCNTPLPTIPNAPVAVPVTSPVNTTVTRTVTPTVTVPQPPTAPTPINTTVTRTVAPPVVVPPIVTPPTLPAITSPTTPTTTPVARTVTTPVVVPPVFVPAPQPLPETPAPQQPSVPAKPPVTIAPIRPCVVPVEDACPSNGVQEFPVLTPRGGPLAITAGPDGNMWFVEEAGGRIGVINKEGEIREFKIPTGSSGPKGIVTGPDGQLWFTELNANKLGSFDPSTESFEEFTLPQSTSHPWGIAAGADGGIWIAEAANGAQIARFDIETHEFDQIKTSDGGNIPMDMAKDANGTLWVTMNGGNRIGKITMPDMLEEFTVPGYTRYDGIPYGVTTTPDGNVWFTGIKTNTVSRMSPDGKTIKTFRVPDGTYPNRIVAGTDGYLYITGSLSSTILKMNQQGTIEKTYALARGSYPTGIAVGPDGTIWLTAQAGNTIGRLCEPGLHPAPPFTPLPPPPASPDPHHGPMPLPEPTAALCGNGTIETPEMCDGGIACSSDCWLLPPPPPVSDSPEPNPPLHIPPAPSPSPDGPQQFCGNNVVEGNEECDGNTNCSADCRMMYPAPGPAPSPSPLPNPNPTPVPVQCTATIKEYDIPKPNMFPTVITPGPDGNVWFTVKSSNRVGRVTPSGYVLTYGDYSIVPNANPNGITAGPDGNLWFTEQDGKNIGQVTPAGMVTEFPVAGANSQILNIATGPDGKLWFTGGKIKSIGRMTVNGLVDWITVPGPQTVGIATAADGTVWYTTWNGHSIGRITTNGIVNEFALPAPYTLPGEIVAHPDGNIWFTSNSNNEQQRAIGRITPAGDISMFGLPSSARAYPMDLTVGPDGAIWVTNSLGIGALFRVDPANGDITPVSVSPTPKDTYLNHITSAGGFLWATDLPGKVGKITVNCSAPAPVAQPIPPVAPVLPPPPTPPTVPAPAPVTLPPAGPAAACVDPDGGDPTVASTVVQWGIVKTPDSCNPALPNYVNEQMCGDRGIRQDLMPCPLGTQCSNGACRQTGSQIPVSTSCTDSDGGVNLMTKGTGDSCNTNYGYETHVYEAYCTGGMEPEGSFQLIPSIPCPTGMTCNNGACL